MKKLLLPLGVAAIWLSAAAQSQEETKTDSVADFKAQLAEIERQDQETKQAELATIKQYIAGKDKLLKAINELENFDCGVAQMQVDTLRAQIADVNEIINGIADVINCESAADLSCINKSSAATEMIQKLQQKVDQKKRQLKELQVHKTECTTSENQ